MFSQNSSSMFQQSPQISKSAYPYEDRQDKIHQISAISDVSIKIKEFSNAMDVSLHLHKIGNQALLDRNTNSKIGNKGFLKKRSLLLQTNQGQNYIPLATINNFLKKTTETGGKEVIKVNYWSTKDAEDYTKDIEILLEDYLPKTKN